MATGSGTGTQASPASAVTAQTLVTRVLAALDDAAEGTWTEEQILPYLLEGIEEYSKHFPRITTAELTTVASTRTYNLPYDTQAVHSVEYPADTDPPSYLTRIPYKRPTWSHNTAYDILFRKDLTAYPALLLSFDPDEDETIRVTLTRPHTADLDLSDNLTVPSHHHHILTQYAQFAAVRQLLHTEQATPTNDSSLIMSQLSTDMRRLELVYLNSINRALYHTQGESEAIVWKMDRWS